MITIRSDNDTYGWFSDCTCWLDAGPASCVLVPDQLNTTKFNNCWTILNQTQRRCLNFEKTLCGQWVISITSIPQNGFLLAFIGSAGAILRAKISAKGNWTASFGIFFSRFCAAVFHTFVRIFSIQSEHFPPGWNVRLYSTFTKEVP